MSDEDVSFTGQQLANISIYDKKPLQEVQNLQVQDKQTPVKPDRNNGSPRKKATPVRSGSDSSPSVDDQVKYNKLVSKSKKLVREGHVPEALHLLKKAVKISFSENITKRIAKMEEYLKECAKESSEDDEGNNNMIDLGNGFYLFKDLYKNLYAHQKEGVLWFWKLYKRKKGGILGDDMGLGKTIQVIGFLSGMFDMEKIRSVLIVNPVSVMSNWEAEFTKWAPGIQVSAFHGTSKKDRERSLRKVQHRGGVLLTTYGMIVTSSEQLSHKDGREFVWDYVILDEGHKIKNPTKTTKGVHAIPAANRIILTGTPVQNNLRELWSLFDFVHQGSLLGTARTFKIEYDTPITKSREKDATIHDRKLGEEMALSLKKMIDPYFLRRTKDEVQKATKKHLELTGADAQESDQAQMPSLTRKNDLVIWLFLSTAQQKIYEDFLSLDTVKELLMTTRSPLVALTVLKKICDHPRLLSNKACAELGLDGDNEFEDSMLDHPSAMESAATKIQNVADEILINESGKLQVLIELIDNLKAEGHRCLVFSQSRKMLDIIQKIITNRGHKVMRLDGTVKHICDRDQRIKTFQNDNSFSVFLLTTQVGGVGLTLTAADRVIIYDPSWNPATDAQAVDRVFRIGQNKNIVIYRLITCGSVEEKIYRRQIFKDSITRQTTGATTNPYRYFSKSELKTLFILDNPRISTTQEQLEQMHGNHRQSDVDLDAHIAYLYSLDIFGVSDHDLMFSQEAVPDELETEGDCAGSSDYIQNRVQKAQQLLEMESSLPTTMEERIGLVPKLNGEDRKQFPNKKPAVFNQPRIHENYLYDQSTVSPIDLRKSEQLNDSAELTIDLTSPVKKDNKMQDTTENYIKIEVDADSNEAHGDIFHVKQEKVEDDQNWNELGNMKKIKSEPIESPQKISATNVKSTPMNTSANNSDCEILDESATWEQLKDKGNNSSSEYSQSGNDMEKNCDNQKDDLKEQNNTKRLNNSDEISEAFHQQKLPSTPKQTGDSVVEEELLISPDPSRPLIGLKLKHRSAMLNYSASMQLVEDDTTLKKVGPKKRLIVGGEESETQTISPGSLLSRTITDFDDHSPQNSKCSGSLASKTIVDSQDAAESAKSFSRSPGSLLNRTILLTDIVSDSELSNSARKFDRSPGSLINRTITEPVFVSPDAAAQNKSSTFKSPASILGQTCLESPEAKSSTSSDGSERGKELLKTYVEESPETSFAPSNKDNGMECIENTPDVTDTNDLNCPDSDLCEDVSSSFQCVGSNEVDDDDDDDVTPVKKLARRRSVCRRRVVDSFEDDGSDRSRPSSAAPGHEESDDQSRPDSAMSIGENTEDDESIQQDAMESETSGRQSEQVSLIENGDVTLNEDDELSVNESKEDSFIDDDDDDDEISLTKEKVNESKEDSFIDDDGDDDDDDDEISSTKEKVNESIKDSFIDGDDDKSLNESIEDDDNDEDDDDDNDNHDDNDDDEENDGDASKVDDEEEEESESSDSDEEDEFDALSPKLQKQFEKLINKGSRLYKEKNLNEALVYILQALEIYADPDLQKWVLKIERKISRKRNGK